MCFRASVTELKWLPLMQHSIVTVRISRVVVTFWTMSREWRMLAIEIAFQTADADEQDSNGAEGLPERKRKTWNEVVPAADILSDEHAAQQ